MRRVAVSGLLCGRRLLRRTRCLPVEGEVLVELAQRVLSQTPVARAQLPGSAESVRAAALLGISSKELKAAMRVELGAMVEPEALLASSRELLGLIRREVRSPCRGTVEAVSSVTGIVRLRQAPTLVSLMAYLPGTVTELIPARGAVIEAEVELIQGIFGLGPEHIGPLVCLVNEPQHSAPAEFLNNAHKNAVVVAGRQASAAFLCRARELGVGAVVAGSASGQGIVEFAGQDINPAVTVDTRQPPTVLLTEGFGDFAMGEQMFSRLLSHEGIEVSVNGATQIRAGVLRPELIAPAGPQTDPSPVPDEQERVRIVRGRHLGRTGVIIACPPEIVEVDSGVRCLVFEVELDTGQSVRVPRPNVERY